MSEIDNWTRDVHEGDAAETVAEMPDDSVHCCMTSPPYWGLRDYGVDGQIGLEESVEEYVEEIVEVGRRIRDVLRDDGSWWLNLGDTYSGGSLVRSDADWTSEGDEGYEEIHTATVDSDNRRSMSKFGPKNKLMVPHRVAIALQEDGWVVRNDVTWYKPNATPQPVNDRLVNSTEMLFHLTPEPDYWYDMEAIEEPAFPSAYAKDGDRGEGEGKIPDDLIKLNTASYEDAHFAVYPVDLCEIPLKATCPPRVCDECGMPHKRSDGWWEAQCECETDGHRPGIVLDPFAGAGSTLKAAKDLDRRFIGVDISKEYVVLSQDRVGIELDDPDLLYEADSALEW